MAAMNVNDTFAYVTDYASTDSSVTLLNGSVNDTDYACISIKTHIPANLLSHKIYMFVSLLCVVMGLIGNTLSVLVFSSKSMREISSNVYLLMLAVSDSIFLVSVLMTKVVTTFRCLYFTDSTIDLLNRNTALCKILQYMLDMFSDYSTCLILAFTVERFIAVYYPLKFKDLCTLRRARATCCALFGIIAVLIAPHHILFMGRPLGYDVCTVLIDYEQEFVIAYVLEAALCRIIPVFAIAVLNVFIIMRVTKVTREKRKLQGAMKLTPTGSSKNGRKRGPGRDDKSTQLTIMLILVSSTYILAYLPVMVHFFMWKLERNELIDVSDNSMTIFQNYARALYISGFAINFFLYTVSGSIFREQLVNILGACLPKDNKHTKADDTKTEETNTLL